MTQIGKRKDIREKFSPEQERVYLMLQDSLERVWGETIVNEGLKRLEKIKKTKFLSQELLTDLHIASTATILSLDYSVQIITRDGKMPYFLNTATQEIKKFFPRARRKPISIIHPYTETAQSSANETFASLSTQ